MNQIVKRLSGLQKFLEKQEGSRIDFTQFPKLTPESVETLKRYPEVHTFNHNGVNYLVSLHMRFTGTIPGRIFLERVPEEKKCYICYIGRKLKTVNCPT